MPSVHVIVSCCHTGPNPAPGLGVARSLKAGFPGAFVVGKDHSTHASGLHSEYFDDVWVVRSWEELDLDEHRAQIIARLEQMNGYYLPCSDLEVRWLGEKRHPRILSPVVAVLDRTTKPFAQVADILPVRVPACMDLETGEREVYNFAVEHGWKVWAKGPIMDAYRVKDWSSLQAAHNALTSSWGNQKFFLQEHISGTEVMLAFAAFQGELLGAALVDKRLVTSEGKCWSGEVVTVPPALLAGLARLVRRLNWTGGGELEMVRDDAGELWLIDWNYRFPAWIHGATLGGINLPALLLAAASGVTPVPAECESTQFTRVVLEIPVQDEIQLPAPPPPVRGVVFSSKISAASPSGLPQLMRRLFGEEKKKRTPARKVRAPRIESALAAAVEQHVDFSAETPARVFLPELAEGGFRATRDAVDTEKRVRLAPGYSVKTNPTRKLMALAREYGFRAEVISAAEARWSLECGFAADEIIYNGPVPFDPAELDRQRVHAVFADSLEAFKRIGGYRPSAAKILGLRLNGFNSDSRFGLRLSTAERFGEVVDCVRRGLPKDVVFGVHSHLQSSGLGVEEWLGQARAFVELARSLENATEQPLRTIDFGGGWTSESFGPFLKKRLPTLIDYVHRRLPNVEEVVIEPGKAVCEQSHVLVSRILEIRRTDSIREVVADACLAEIPLAVHFPRALYLRSANGRLRRLARGYDRVLGRICMEHDILASGIKLPADAREGDALIFSHAGAYEATMSYTFGLGGFHEQ